MTQMRTACHRCRTRELARTEDEDGVVRIHSVPSVGDGEIVDERATAGGFTALVNRMCPDCGGTGWLDGFQAPC